MEYKSYQAIYMPVSQAVFALGNALFGNNLIGYKFLYLLFDIGVMALLRHDGARWQIVEYVIGPSDVAWDGWRQERHLPRQLFTDQ